MATDPQLVRAPEPPEGEPKYKMADGSYPIDDCEDVSDAAKLAHNSKTYSFDQVKAHVLKAKNGLGCPDSALPESWNSDEGSEKKSEPIPRDTLFRAYWPGPELRKASSGGGMPTLTGHFAVFNQWTKIDSVFEGRFMESLAPGAFKKTISENRAAMRVLFQHGKDPQIGNKPLGPIAELREEDGGAYYEVPLLDTSYNRDLIPGLEAGLYGASFRFRVTREDLNPKPERSAHNPEGIPERTVREVQLQEFGPVTFPAYAGATAGLRSVTDEFVFGQYLQDPDKLRELLSHLPARAVAPPEADAEAPHLSPGRREDPPKRGSIPVVRNPNKKRSP